MRGRGAGVAVAFAIVAALAGLDDARAHGEPGHALDFDQAPSDTLPWGVLAKVGIRRSGGRVIAEFLPPVAALHGQRVTLYGHATAAAAGTAPQRRFLLTPRPIVCPGCEEPLGPEGVVAVELRRPIAPPARPIAVRGRFLTVRDDPDAVLYRIEDASVVRGAALHHHDRPGR